MKPDETLDLTGIPCPANTAQALIRIATMMEGEILELIVDAGEPLQNVPPSLEAEGHKLRLREPCDNTRWRLHIEVGK